MVSVSTAIPILTAGSSITISDSITAPVAAEPDPLTTTAGASDSDVYWNFYRTTLGFGASAVSNPEKQITKENSTKIPNTGNVATIQAGDGITLVFPFGNRNRVEA